MLDWVRRLANEEAGHLLHLRNLLAVVELGTVDHDLEVEVGLKVDGRRVMVGAALGAEHPVLGLFDLVHVEELALVVGCRVEVVLDRMSHLANRLVALIG